VQRTGCFQAHTVSCTCDCKTGGSKMTQTWRCKDTHQNNYACSSARTLWLPLPLSLLSVRLDVLYLPLLCILVNLSLVWKSAEVRHEVEETGCAHCLPLNRASMEKCGRQSTWGRRLALMMARGRISIALYVRGENGFDAVDTIPARNRCCQQFMT
jgi:hypothetical protein